MEKISLPDNYLVDYYLNEVKFRSFVTMEIMLSTMRLFKKDGRKRLTLKKETLEIFVESYHKHFVKVIIIEMLLENRNISRIEVFKECCEHVSYESMDCNFFNEFFARLKNYCNQNHQHKLIEFRE